MSADNADSESDSDIDEILHTSPPLPALNFSVLKVHGHEAAHTERNTANVGSARTSGMRRGGERKGNCRSSQKREILKNMSGDNVDFSDTHDSLKSSEDEVGGEGLYSQQNTFLKRQRWDNFFSSEKKPHSLDLVD